MTPLDRARGRAMLWARLNAADAHIERVTGLAQLPAVYDTNFIPSGASPACEVLPAVAVARHASHTERIVCPACRYICIATVEHTWPFYSYVHTCRCGYVILEQEWEREFGAPDSRPEGTEP